MDDLILEDLLLSAYRLSWAPPQRREHPARRLARLVSRTLAPERLEGWPITLSHPDRS